MYLPCQRKKFSACSLLFVVDAILTLVETFPPQGDQRNPDIPGSVVSVTLLSRGDLKPGDRERLNDKTNADPWLVGLDVAVAEREDVADGPRPHQFAKPALVA